MIFRSFLISCLEVMQEILKPANPAKVKISNFPNILFFPLVIKIHAFFRHSKTSFLHK